MKSPVQETVSSASVVRSTGRGADAEATWEFVLLAMLGIFAVNLLLRAFYIRYQFVNGDEAVRALTALGVLRGDRLYVDVITDKPPGTTLFYAVVLFFFNHSMPAVHIAATVWNFGTAVAVFALGARFYSTKTSLLASLLFVYFSASYHTQDAMAANTELLMSLPYTVSVFCYLRGSSFSWLRGVGARPAGTNKDRKWLIAAGFLGGITGLFKQVGVLVLVFFALSEALNVITDHRFSRGQAQDTGASPRPRVIRMIGRLGLIATGAVIVAVALMAWLWVTGALSGFWRNAMQLGAFYVRSLPIKLWVKFLFLRTLGYVLLCGALWALAGLGLYRAVRLLRLEINSEASPSGYQSIDGFNGTAAAIDASMALWCLVSLAGVFTSGRFYGHYFIPALPALSLLGARGVAWLVAHVASPSGSRRTRAVAAAIFIMFAFNLFRFHHRTGILAYETITGRRTQRSEAWGMTRREREADQVAEIVRSRVGNGQPLYIWGYALEVYWRSGCVPASRYLTPYYLTGRFYPEVTGTSERSPADFWREARDHFIADLRRTRPRLILNIDEPVEKLPYPEIVNFIQENYRYDGLIGPDPTHQFIVYAIRDATQFSN